MRVAENFCEEFIVDTPADIKTSASQPGKVSCVYCATHSRTPWFLEKNLSHHLNRPSHLKAVAEAQAKQETKEIVDRLRDEGLQQLQESGHFYAQLSHSRQLGIPPAMIPPQGVDEKEMWDDFELDRSNPSFLDASVASQYSPSEQNEIEFNRALDRAEAGDPTEWGFEDFDTECDVDETLTNVMQNLGQSQMVFRV
jgi:hypothetical protein